MESESEQLLVLAKSHKAKALEMIIEKVLADPSIYKFSEFLDIENVQKLGGSNKYLKSLKLFAYENYEDYKNNSKEYIVLNEKQLKKLKMLSVITMAGKSKTLSYTKLSKDLDISSKKDLEDILLELIYNRLINATLDEKNKVVYVEWTFGRDTKKEDVDEMVEKLELWVEKMKKVETNVERHINDLDNSLMRSKQDKREFVQLCMESNNEENKKGMIGKVKEVFGFGK